MRAAWYEAMARRARLSVGEMPAPEPGLGEVGARTPGVNPSDWKSRAGNARRFSARHPAQTALSDRPRRSHPDAAGR
jgi:NADPH:quinone reductase-like Zn-dependent oxidoreductase